MVTTIPLTKRGSLTLPPALRRKMGLDKLRTPMVLIGSFTASKRAGSHGGSPKANRTAKTVITKPKGTDNPGIVIGEQNGSARTTVSKAEARAPSAAINSRNVTVCLSNRAASTCNSSENFFSGSGDEGITEKINKEGRGLTRPQLEAAGSV